MQHIDSLFRPLLVALLLLFAPWLPAQTTIFFEDFESGTLNPAFWTANPGPVNGLAGVRNNTQLAGVAYSGAHGLALGKTSDVGGFNSPSSCEIAKR